jgi:hypothetical protein
VHHYKLAVVSRAKYSREVVEVLEERNKTTCFVTRVWPYLRHQTTRYSRKSCLSSRMPRTTASPGESSGFEEIDRRSRRGAAFPASVAKQSKVLAQNLGVSACLKFH